MWNDLIVPRKEQFSGCLVGQCLGDATGFPFEGHPAEICQQYVHGILKKGRARIVLGTHTFPFGQYTDDSQLARELISSYCSRRCFDPSDYAHRIAMMFKENKIIGYGQSTKQAALRLIEGVSWEKSGTRPIIPSNGSAMRAAPVGLFFFNDFYKLILTAHDQARITHNDRRCSAGAVVIAGAVALALTVKPIGISRFLFQLAELAEKIEESVATGVRKLFNWISLPPKKAAYDISKFGLPSNYYHDFQGIPPISTNSVLWSLYSFLKTPDDYWETICTAIEGGGDVDTTAAMAGAISGAYLGLEKIPKDLAQYLTDRGTWRFDELVNLAHNCYELKSGELNLPT